MTLKSRVSAVSFAIFLTLQAGAPARALAEEPVTQEQFKQLIRIFKNVVDRFDKIEGRMSHLESGGGGGKKGSSDGAVNLDNLSSEAAPPGGAPAGNNKSMKTTHGANAEPGFKIYFDLNFYNRPGTASELTFDNFHAFFMAEMLPIPEMQFAFDITGGTSPRWYELDYQVHPKLQLRAGRIWIPFDDMSPHNIFGGRVNVSRLSVTADQFLPDLWTDLGVGFKLSLIDSSKMTFDLHGYVVNGFANTGKDLYTGTVNAFPGFTGSLGTDNNRNKAFGGRAQVKFFGKLGLGASAYRGRWSAQTQAEKNLTILGGDAQLRLPFGTEFRVGGALMTVDRLTIVDTAKRLGYYGEASQSFGSKRQYKIMARGGGVNLDDRVIAASDQQLVGGTLLWRLGLVELSVEHSRDLHKVASKLTYSFTNLRLVIAL